MFECDFCSKECKNHNSYRNHIRTCPSNPNRQITNRNTGRKTGNQFTRARAAGLPDPVVSEESRRKQSLATKGKSRKPLSEEHKRKLSLNRTKFYQENPDLIPYRLYHSSKESYPERYFREIFEKEGLVFKPQLPVSVYNLDFAFIDKMIDFEVNGDTHLKPKIIAKDIRRKQKLEKFGWKVISLDWSKYQSLEADFKSAIVSEILDLVR